MKSSQIRKHTPQLRSGLTFVAAATLALVAGCSSGGGDGDGGTDAQRVVQDLTIDPTGVTLVVPAEEATGSLGSVTVEVSGGQNLVGIRRAGDELVLEFDQVVNPNHRVRVFGIEGLSDGWRDVGTTDPRQPRMGILNATQDTSDALLGGDTLTVAILGGARAVTDQVEDPQSWSLEVNGLDLDMTGSVIQFNAASGIADVTLGPLANLHASFRLSLDVETVAAASVNPAFVQGVATGDSSPPLLDGASPVLQVLDPLASGDEYGRVVEFDFNEPISPVFGANASNFDVIDHGGASLFTSVTRVGVDPLDNSILRVFFSRPVVPGLDSVEVDGVVDAHGNPFPAQTLAIEAGSTVANGFTSVDFVTQEGLGNDALVVVLDQAIDPDTATASARWTLDVGGLGAIDLSTQSISYDLLTKTVRFDLDFDVQNGTTCDLDAVGQQDIDGEIFTQAAPQVTAAGDSGSPGVGDIVQNRDLDPSGKTLDVVFTEDLDVVSAADPSNYTLNPAIVVNGATLVDGSMVRLELADLAVPGDVQLTVAAAVSDPAGNSLGADFGPAPIDSTDSDAPSPTVAAARAVEGPANDEVTVLFSDQLIKSEVEDPASWNFESPVGTPMDLTGATIDYSEVTGVASLTIDGSVNQSLLLMHDYQVSFAGIRDLGGNSIVGLALGGSVVGESQIPQVESTYIASGTEIVVRFSEAMGRLDDLYDPVTNVDGARIELTDSLSQAVSYPSGASPLDEGLGVNLTFPGPVDPGDTLAILGLTDLAGNPLFPVTGLVLDPEDTSEPSFGGAPVLTAVSGVANDTISIQFGAPMASWRLLDPSKYTLEESGGAATVDLTGATFSLVGTDTVELVLTGASSRLRAGATYDFVLASGGDDPLRTRQGVALSGPVTSGGMVVGGDVVSGPTAVGTRAVVDPMDPNAALVVFDETVDMSAALDPLSYTFGGGAVAMAAAEVSDRTVRVAFNVPVTLGGVVDVQSTAAVDTAGNASAGVLSVAVTGDQDGPALVSVTATANEGVGGDLVVMTFDEELDPGTAQDPSRFSVLSSVGGSDPLRLGAAVYSSTDQSVTLYVQDLVDGSTVTATATGLTDVFGNVAQAALTDSAVVAGDSDAPFIQSAFVNRFASSNGRVIEVLFSETVVGNLVVQAGTWSTTGAASVLGVERVAPDRVQILVTSVLGSGDLLEMAQGVMDAAGNPALAQSVNPVD